MLNTQGKVLRLVLYGAIFIQLASCVTPKRRLPVALNEVSGMVVREDSLLLLNDGGNPAELYALPLDSAGKRVIGRSRAARSRSVDAANTDWEALTAPFRDTTEALCICDIGDNAHGRTSVSFFAVRRGSSEIDTFRVRYPSYPHNAEACFVYRDSLYVLTKAEVTRKPKLRPAYLYRVPLGPETTTMVLIDSLFLRRKSVTDAALVSENRLAVLSYDYRLAGPFPLTSTSLYAVDLTPAGKFASSTLTQKRVRAPFTLTQYESVAPAGPGHVLIASERTLVIPARWRRVPLPQRVATAQPRR